MTDNDNAGGKKRFSWQGLILGGVVVLVIAIPAFLCATCASYTLSQELGLPVMVGRRVAEVALFAGLAAAWWAVYKVIADRTKR